MHSSGVTCVEKRREIRRKDAENESIDVNAIFTRAGENRFERGKKQLIAFGGTRSVASYRLGPVKIAVRQIFGKSLSNNTYHYSPKTRSAGKVRLRLVEF